jgi:RNA polymerase sigma-70 factor, ECF subfamily
VDHRDTQGEPQIGLPDETRWAAQGGASVDARVAEAYASVNGDVVRYLGAVVGRSVAEDVASQVWVEVVGRAGAFRGDQAAFRRWVLATARRRALDHRRRWWQRSVVLRPPGAYELDQPAADAELGEDVTAAVARIKCLPAPQAEVILLRVLGGYSAEEVAELTGRTPGSVRVIQHRALRRLADELEREARPEGGV